MKKEYKAVEMTITEFETEDVITTSVDKSVRDAYVDDLQIQSQKPKT